MSSIIDAVWSLRTGMRRLWADHAIWTRQYIVAAVAGTPDAEHAAARLLRNRRTSAMRSSPTTERRRGLR